MSDEWEQCTTVMGHPSVLWRTRGHLVTAAEYRSWTVTLAELRTENARLGRELRDTQWALEQARNEVARGVSASVLGGDNS